MSLTGSLLERIQQAILDAFDYDDLRQFVKHRLDENFENITLPANLKVAVFELLLWAERQGREQELLDKLVVARPAKAEFAVLAAALRTGQPLPAHPRHAGPFPLQKPLRIQHFIGRELELARLLADLQPGAVLTLCGPGGVGKTALAAEAVWRLAPGDDPPDRFPDGIIFHTFYHQPQAALALEAIARAYGIDPRPSSQDAARQALANRKALLILDGAEAADDLDAVLQVAGSSGVLITTRPRSGAPDEAQDITPLPRDESLQLLRAWAGKYADDDGAANDLVRLLGGLPLALFLVGRYLSQRRQAAGEYVPWLQEEGLGALHFGERPSKSVPLLLRRSLEQVSEQAQAAFGVAGVLALAPFPADPVAAALELSPAAAHHALGELVDYGLLLRPDDHYQVTHALAHSYARERATPSAEVIGRLALYYAALAERESKQGLPGYAVLDIVRAHIVAVQAAALNAQQWDAVRQITWQTRDYLDLKGYWTERIAVVQAGLDAARAVKACYDEGAFLTLLGLAYAALGETRRAIQLYEQALVIDREIGDRQGEGNTLGSLGLACAALGETRRAIEYHEQGLVVMREIGDRQGEGNTLGNLGSAYANLGETRRAIELYEQALVIDREIGDCQGEGNTLGNLGNAYADLGETRRAIEYHEQALVIAREIGARREEGNALGNLGNAYYFLGETRRTIEYHEQALVIAREIGSRGGEGNVLGNLGNAYAALGETRRTIEYHEQALVIAREIGDRREEGTTLGNLGAAYHSLGETRRAVELYEQALVILHEIGNRRPEAIHSWNLGLAYEREGDLARAAANMQVYVDYLHEIGHPDAAKRAQRVAALRARLNPNTQE